MNVWLNYRVSVYKNHIRIHSKTSTSHLTTESKSVLIYLSKAADTDRFDNGPGQDMWLF